MENKKMFFDYSVMMTAIKMVLRNERSMIEVDFKETIDKRINSIYEKRKILIGRSRENFLGLGYGGKWTQESLLESIKENFDFEFYENQKREMITRLDKIEKNVNENINSRGYLVGILNGDNPFKSYTQSDLWQNIIETYKHILGKPQNNSVSFRNGDEIISVSPEDEMLATLHSKKLTGEEGYDVSDEDMRLASVILCDGNMRKIIGIIHSNILPPQTIIQLYDRLPENKKQVIKDRLDNFLSPVLTNGF